MTKFLASQANNANTPPCSSRLSCKLPKFWLMALGLCMGLSALPAQAAEVASFEVVAREGRLLPERLEVPAGVKLRLTLRNEGKAPVEFENLELRVEKVLAPNAAAVVVIQPLKPGTYTFIDEFHAETGKMLIIAK